MSLIVSELYKVLKKLGASEEQAEKASAEVVNFDKKVKKVTEELDRNIYNLKKDNENNFELLRKDIINIQKEINCKFNVLTTIIVTLFGGLLITLISVFITIFLK